MSGLIGLFTTLFCFLLYTITLFSHCGPAQAHGSIIRGIFTLAKSTDV